jgi:hypothetical protein
MDFLIKLIEMTVVSGCIGLFLLKIGKDNLLGIVGVFALLGAVGGLVFLGLMCSALVYYKVSNATFALLGLICAAPFVFVPAYVLYKLTSSNGREYDGRGFEDGDGSN